MERMEYYSYLQKYQKREEEGTVLIHHGIKGQKWGIRRFQNEDGTLTEEGKRRYGKYYDENGKISEEGKRVMHRKEASLSTASTLFKIFKYMNLGSTGLMAIPYTVASCSALGPIGLVAGGLVVGTGLATAGVHGAISKACQRRADVYYELLQKG